MGLGPWLGRGGVRVPGARGRPGGGTRLCKGRGWGAVGLLRPGSGVVVVVASFCPSLLCRQRCYAWVQKRGSLMQPPPLHLACCPLNGRGGLEKRRETLAILPGERLHVRGGRGLRLLGSEKEGRVAGAVRPLVGSR